MVELTVRAAQAIEGLRPARLPDHRILRIARDARSRFGTARLTFVAVPRPGDLIGESQGIALCVGEDLVARLDGLVFDIRDGDAGFVVREPQHTRRHEDTDALIQARPATSEPSERAEVDGRETAVRPGPR